MRKALLTWITIFFLLTPLFCGEKKDLWFERSLEFTLELTHHYDLVEDEEALARLNRIGYAIVANVPEVKYPYTFHLVKMRSPNAFALPGGFVFVTTGMWNLKLSDDELAALLGHEITHVWKQHAVHMQHKATLLSALSQALVMGVLFGVKDNHQRDGLPWVYAPDSRIPYEQSRKDNLLQGAIAFGTVFQELLMQGYSRANEMEADREGMLLMSRAGFDPKGGVNLLNELHTYIYEAPGYGYWRSHPYFDSRVSAAKARLADLKVQPPTSSRLLRKRTQDQLLLYARDEEKKEPTKLLESFAYWSYPHGIVALNLRRQTLDARMNTFYADSPINRNYGDTLKEIQALLTHFGGDTDLPDGTLKPLIHLRDKIEDERIECRPIFTGVMEHGVPGIPFLERFISNYPDDDFAGEAAYRASISNHRLGNERQAVGDLIKAYRSRGWQREAVYASLSLVPSLEKITQVNRLYGEMDDPLVKEAAMDRMAFLVTTIKDIKDIALFLEDAPTSPYHKAALNRLHTLAMNDYRQGAIYDSVGENQKALDIFNTILLYAPESKAAGEIREKIIENNKLFKEGD